MPLYLSNDDQRRATSIPEAIEAMERMLRQFARGDAIRRPRIDNFLPSTRAGEFFCFSSMEGGSRAPGYYALRIKPDIISWPTVYGKVRQRKYAVRPGLYGGLVLLYDTDNAAFLALLNDGHIQHVRVAVTAALGVKSMARADSKVLGIIGSGGMARYFAMAMKAVRPIGRVQAYSPHRGHLDQYCAEMGARLGCEVVACRSAADAVGDADIISLCTSSHEPVIEHKHIRPGVHVTNVQTNELSPEAFARIEVVGLLARRTPMSAAGYVDDDYGGIRGSAMAYVGGQTAERAKVPVYPKNPDRYPNARYVDCVNAQTGEPYHRERPDEITTLATNSNGVLEGETGPSSGFQGLQFASVAGAMYESARRMAIGTKLPDEMFLQDIPT